MASWRPERGLDHGRDMLDAEIGFLRAEFGRASGAPVPDESGPRLPLHAVLSEPNEKATARVAFSFIGGGGGNRTRVRKPSAVGSTCVSCLLF